MSLSEYSIPLGRRFRALKLWAVAPLLRARGPAGDDPRARPAGAAFEAGFEAEPGWEVCAPRHFSLVCFRLEGADEDNEALLERVNDSGRDLPLAHEARPAAIVLRLAIGNARTTEDDVRLAWDVLRREARSPAL